MQYFEKTVSRIIVGRSFCSVLAMGTKRACGRGDVSISEPLVILCSEKAGVLRGKFAVVSAEY